MLRLEDILAFDNSKASLCAIVSTETEDKPMTVVWFSRPCREEPRKKVYISMQLSHLQFSNQVDEKLSSIAPNLYRYGDNWIDLSYIHAIGKDAACGNKSKYSVLFKFTDETVTINLDDADFAQIVIRKSELISNSKISSVNAVDEIPF